MDLTNTITLDVKLPKDTPTSPGNLLLITKKEGPPSAKVDVIYETQIQVEISCYGVDFNALGGAVGGEGYIRTSGGVRSWQGTAKTLAHEIAHNLGQGYSAADGIGGWGTDGQRDRRRAVRLEISRRPVLSRPRPPGVSLRQTAVDVMKEAKPKDRTDVEKGSFSSPSDAHDRAWFSKLKDEKHCVMWGSGPESPTKTRNFCDACLAHMRATDTSDVNKIW